MNQDSTYYRRPSVARSIHGANIPRPPPPPVIAPRPLQRARDAAYAATRLFGYSPSRPPSPPSEREDDRFARGSALFHRRAPLGMQQNASASHRTGLEINTIAINERGTHALIAGKEIFKTVKVEDGRCTEDFNLRTAILSTPKNASGAPRDIYQIDIADVAWAKGDHGDFVAAATSSGKIIIYNLEIAGLKAVQLHEHFRQVHKITFNPHKGNLLLSGSQDGTVRLWDIREARSKSNTLQSKRKYSGQADGVRDVKWSPTEGLDFAFGTDSGDIQRWDIRNLRSPKVKISGHLLACNAIDWHPDGKHIISASSDKTVRVFDISVGRPKKASWEIKTPYPVMNARWRPSCESAMPSDNGARLCVQVLTSYDRSHPVMHLYDLRRPALPFRELSPYKYAPTDFLWHSQDLLWTVGHRPEGSFLQTDVKHVPKLIERRNLQTTALSSLHEVVVVAQAGRDRHALSFRKPALQPQPSSGLSTASDSELSRSWADDSIDHVFLGLLPRRRHYSHSENTSRTQTSTSSPVTGIYSNSSIPTIKLDDVLQNRKSTRPQQTACRGFLKSQNGAHIVVAMPLPSLPVLQKGSSAAESIEHIATVIDECIEKAASFGFLRLSQTWKIVQHCVINHLQERMTLRQKLIAANQLLEYRSKLGIPLIPVLASRLASSYVKSPTQSPSSMRPVSSIAQHLIVPDSTSNVPTPLARATGASRLAYQLSLPDPADETIELPPSLAPSRSLLSTLSVDQKQEDRPEHDHLLTTDNLSDFQKQQAKEESNDRIDMVRRWSVQPKVPLNFDRIESQSGDQPPRLEKHDSDESFKFLEGSFDSRSAGFPLSSSSIESIGQIVAERPSRSQISITQTWEQNLPAPSKSPPFGGSGTLAERAGDKPCKDEKSFEAVSTSWSVQDPFDDRRDSVKKASSGGSSSKVSETSLAPEILPGAPIAHDPEDRVDAEDNVRPGRQDTTAHTSSHLALSADDSPLGFGDVLSNHAARDVEYIDIEEHKPWTLVAMLRKLMEYYTIEQPSPQAVSTLMLTVAPLLPLTHPIPENDIRQTIRIYLEYFIDNLTIDVHDIERWFAACDYEQSLLAGLLPLQMENVLATYHEHLLSQRLFPHAAELRQIAYPAYPAVYEDFVKDNTVHFKCGSCGKVMHPTNSKTRCTNCRPIIKACPICWMSQSPWATKNDATSVQASETAHHRKEAKMRTACLSCGHSGHAECYQNWFAESAGIGCPYEGCLCICVSVGEAGSGFESHC